MDAIAAPRPAHDAPGHPRLIGLAVATLIALGVLAAELVIFGTSIMLVSLLVAPYLGWCLGPDAAASRRPARTVIFGLPALVLTSACAMVWYAAVRRLATIGRCEVAR